jgi:hypothetical protein
VEDARAVHVVQRLQQLPHVQPDEALGQVHPTPADELIDIFVHQLEHQRQAARPVVTVVQVTGHGRFTPLGQQDF